ncbi:DNA-binding IclR family transcriptional regulator [Sphingomonas jinjuensis]|uniref:DNA-binding IclR family transcriptional regulator n=1 Tax=Sphingomonas jinjuensis TaxID=535907 RepID=A0A840FIP0_9SPHN|nr:IclR family transcriptional regulator C-terminal domain-containing protein [Sphingomonas jinjuensis]MBB4155557.1 DNA-binding IclR family transcriptional regulator [Sphingomonas jinjuensis]
MTMPLGAASLTLVHRMPSPGIMSEETEGPGKGKLVGAVVQTVKLLRVLAASDAPLGVSAAARAAEVNTSTAFNVLRTLSIEGLVDFDAATKSYSLGAGLFDIAKGLLGRNLVDLIRPEIVRLANETGRLIALWEVVDDRVVLIDKALVDRPVRLDLAVTQRMPLMLGAVGRAAAAGLDIDDQELRRHFRKLRWAGSIDASRYLAEVKEARRTGYGVDRETLYNGIVAIAAIITDETGRPAYGISAIELANRIDDDEIAHVGERLAATAASLSRSPRTLA